MLYYVIVVAIMVACVVGLWWKNETLKRTLDDRTDQARFWKESHERASARLDELVEKNRALKRLSETNDLDAFISRQALVAMVKGALDALGQDGLAVVADQAHREWKEKREQKV